MNLITDIQEDKPSVEAIKDYYNKVSAGICRQYKFFYFQCCVPEKANENFELYDYMTWDYGFLSRDLSLDENNMIAVEIADFINFTDKQIQDILDKLEQNAIIEIKRIEAENKLKRISEDF
jgi:hypothetical protein